MIKSNRPKYLIEADHKNKIINIKLSGFFRIKEAEEFITQLYKYVSQIKLRFQYSLIIDCSEICIFKREILKIVENVYSGCREYENIVFLNPISILPRIQIQDVINKCKGFSRNVFFDTREEVYLYLGINIIKKSETINSPNSENENITNNFCWQYFYDILKKDKITRN